MECLKGLVGVIKEDCECITGQLTPEQKAILATATSGLYLEDLPGGVSMAALRDLESCKDFFKMSTGAIARAEKKLEDDLTTALAAKNKTKGASYAGSIGQMSYAGSLSGNLKDYQGTLLRTSRNSDAVLILNRMFITVNAAVFTTVKIFKALRGSVVGEVIKEFEVETAANTYTLIDTEKLKLPLSEKGKPLDYYFLYERLGAVPKDNKIDCGCSQQQTATLNSFLIATGVQMDEVNTFNTAVSDKYAHGLSLDVNIKCNSEQLFCREYDETEAISVVMSNAVWFKAGELLIEDIQKSTEINRFTTMSKEYLWGKRNHFRSSYEGKILWITENINVSDSNCFVCSDESLIAGPIIVTDGFKELRESEEEFRDISGGSENKFSYLQ